MTTKKQILQLAQLHLARNEDEHLTCYICLAIDTAASLTIRGLEERPWLEELKEL